MNNHEEIFTETDIYQSENPLLSETPKRKQKRMQMEIFDHSTYT